jgi:nicotinamide mononucleotide adenylyltransferase
MGIWPEKGNAMPNATGVVHGRFQLFHLDHLKYLLAAKARCRHLVVGITNPDPTLTKFDPADPHRSAAQDNPLTFYERYLMLRETLLDAGLSSQEFSLVPLPINFPELYRYYVPLDATFFLTIYDEWGERKLQLFQSLGLKVEILWRKPASEKGLTATAIRRLIGLGQPWEHLVPAAVARLVKEMGLLERLRIPEA